MTTVRKVSEHARRKLHDLWRQKVLPRLEAEERKRVAREQAIAEAKAAERKNWTSIDYMNARLRLISSTPLRTQRIQHTDERILEE
jgi:hypothetical protein